MKLPRRGMTQRQNDELRWYYQDSAADVGMSAAGFEPSPVVTPASAPPPTAKQQAAARRQSRVRRALAGLDVRHQAILEICYTVCLGADLGHNAGDGAVHRALREDATIPVLQKRINDAKAPQKQLHRDRLGAHRDQIARDVMAEVKAAHMRYAEIRHEHRDAEQTAAMRAETPAQLVEVTRMAELPPSPQEQQRNAVAAFIEELGLNDVSRVAELVKGERS